MTVTFSDSRIMPVQRQASSTGKLRFALANAVAAKPEKKKREKVKADPVHVAAARELRDRYLEQFNSGLILPQGKYEVSRTLTSASSVESSEVEGSRALPDPRAATTVPVIPPLLAAPMAA